MDFLKNLAIPQSAEHFHLILLISALSAQVFLPYMGISLGSAMLSRRLNRLGRREGNAAALQLSRALAETVFANATVIMILGILPGLTIVFALVQMVQGTSSIAVDLAGFGFLFLACGFVLLYTYRYTFRVQGLLEAYQGLVRKHEENLEGNLDSYSVTNLQVHFRSGAYGIAALTISGFLYSAAMTMALDPAPWPQSTSFLDVLFSGAVWLRLLLIFVFTVGTTGMGVLYFTFVWKAGELGEDEASAQLARRYGIRWSVISLIVFPPILLIHLAMLPAASLSGLLFGLGGIALFLMFVAAHFVYVFFKTHVPKAAAYAFSVFLLAGAILLMNDHLALAYVTRNQAAILAIAHSKATEELKASLGVAPPAISGEEVYTTRCASCHLFDQKKFGPPYAETLPKYRNKKGDLIAFILNPVKINPAYSAMPNPALKPAEADSVATYLLAKALSAVNSAK